MNTINKIEDAFFTRFGKDPILIASPGRINLIGEHTDYNNGFVLPAAIDKAIYFAVKPNFVNKFRFFAYDLNESFETTTYQIEKSKVHWANYLLGVIAQFVKDGKKFTGFDCVFGGDVPAGAGMSSSAAIECGIATAINHMNKLNYNTLQLALIAQQAEHEYAGVQCGIMDQFASLHGRANQVIRLDCRSLDYTYFPFNMNNVSLILVNTGIKHALADSAYNNRRQECETGVKILSQHFPQVESLRDANLNMMEKIKPMVTKKVFDRCTYVIEENLRVKAACEALLNEDIEAFGQFMNQSHVGLRDKYEVSCTELDQLVDQALETKGVLGARMMGGGFGGCTLNLIRKKSVPNFVKTIKANYNPPELLEPQIIEVVIGHGTAIVAHKHD